jgi:hypothetical protein
MNLEFPERYSAVILTGLVQPVTGVDLFEGADEFIATTPNLLESATPRPQ